MLPAIELPPFKTFQLRPIEPMSDEAFFEFCQRNKELRIERTATGEIIMDMPAGGESSYANGMLFLMIANWALENENGVTFESSAGFILPNGATRSPDVAWVKRERLAHLTQTQKKKFLPVSPNFVIELRSPSDSLTELKRKMEEYVDNGVELGWLINPEWQEVWVYRPNHPPQHLQQPQTLHGDPELPKLQVELETIWNPDF